MEPGDPAGLHRGGLADQRPVASDRTGAERQPDYQPQLLPLPRQPARLVAHDRLPPGRKRVSFAGSSLPGPLVHEAATSRSTSCPAARAHPGSRCSRIPASPPTPAVESGAGPVMQIRPSPTGARRQAAPVGRGLPREPDAGGPAHRRRVGDGSSAAAPSCSRSLPGWRSWSRCSESASIRRSRRSHRPLETVGFLLAVSLLAASAIAYLFGRLGFYYRARQHRRSRGR